MIFESYLILEPNSSFIDACLFSICSILFYILKSLNFQVTIRICLCVCEQTGGGLAQAVLCGPGRKHFLSSPLVSGAIL